ncbi:MAG TPA: hypothetical protein VM715_01345 [Candidatus Acidoferrum sp.]|jgi:hypothetical protein|nr:hypothetical protein [Candidatus Acidoferrum sp.]
MTNGTERFEWTSEETARNQTIIKMYTEDPNISKIARTFGISLTRVKQVLDKHGMRKTRHEGSAGQYHSKTWDATTHRVLRKDSVDPKWRAKLVEELEAASPLDHGEQD